MIRSLPSTFTHAPARACTRAWRGGAATLLLTTAMLGMACAEAAGGKAVTPADATPAVPDSAAWHQWQDSFRFFGVGTRYSCDELRRKLKRTLIHLGTREADLSLIAVNCGLSPLNASGLPRIKITASTLRPIALSATPEGTREAAAALGIPVQWKKVTLGMGPSRDERDCEFNRQVLQVLGTHFSIRKKTGDLVCVPNNVGAFHDAAFFEVLVPSAATAVAPAAAGGAPSSTADANRDSASAS
ncbi:hypothetical protein [Nevskia sp.]|uniref:hypothetical protein n=1 Tax=Nevskia sp. TaxID=1929292 RepID=UPI0025F106B7|nr:hypothetical protein [Nevskia sp.]